MDIEKFDQTPPTCMHPDLHPADVWLRAWMELNGNNGGGSIQKADEVLARYKEIADGGENKALRQIIKDLYNKLPEEKACIPHETVRLLMEHNVDTDQNTDEAEVTPIMVISAEDVDNL